MGLIGALKPWASARKARLRQLRAKVFPENRSALAVVAIMKNEALKASRPKLESRGIPTRMIL